MKFYAVYWRWDGSDSDDPVTEWFTSKKKAIARAKELAIEKEEGIYGGALYVYQSEVPTTKKALLKWLNGCGGVIYVPGNNLIRQQEAMTSVERSPTDAEFFGGGE